MRVYFCAAAVLSASLAVSQAPTHISPKEAVNHLSPGNNGMPFAWVPMSYQQVHDISTFSSTTPATFRLARFRMARDFVNQPGPTIDVDMFMAQSPNNAANASATYANNVTQGTQINVFTRKMVNLPQIPDTSWSIRFPFDNPFMFPGNTHLSWRTNIYSISAMMPFYPQEIWEITGFSERLGTGCAARGGSGTADLYLRGTGLFHGGTIHHLGEPKDNAHQTPAIFTVGLSETAWGPITLPLALAPFGAPGCFVNNDWAVVIPTFASPVAIVALSVPDERALIGAKYWCQFAFVNPAANPLGLFTSNSLRNTIGTWVDITKIVGQFPGGTSGLVQNNNGLAIALN